MKWLMLLMAGLLIGSFGCNQAAESVLPSEEDSVTQADLQKMRAGLEAKHAAEINQLKAEHQREISLLKAQIKSLTPGNRSRPVVSPPPEPMPPDLPPGMTIPGRRIPPKSGTIEEVNPQQTYLSVGAGLTPSRFPPSPGLVSTEPIRSHEDFARDLTNLVSKWSKAERDKLPERLQRSRRLMKRLLALPDLRAKEKEERDQLQAQVEQDLVQWAEGQGIPVIHTARICQFWKICPAGPTFSYPLPNREKIPVLYWHFHEGALYIWR